MNPDSVAILETQDFLPKQVSSLTTPHPTLINFQSNPNSASWSCQTFILSLSLSSATQQHWSSLNLFNHYQKVIQARKSRLRVHIFAETEKCEPNFDRTGGEKWTNKQTATIQQGTARAALLLVQFKQLANKSVSRNNLNGERKQKHWW